MRTEKEKLLSEIDQLEAEKVEIEEVLPILMDKLLQIHSNVEDMRGERSVYETAIEDMMESYAMILQPGNAEAVWGPGGVEEGEEQGGHGEGTEGDDHHDYLQQESSAALEML